MKLPNFNLESHIKEILRIFRKWVKKRWDKMWIEVHSKKKTMSIKPYYWHNTKSREASLKYFFTESEYGFMVPVNIYESNLELFHLLIF